MALERMHVVHVLIGSLEHTRRALLEQLVDDREGLEAHDGVLVQWLLAELAPDVDGAVVP